MPFSVQWQWFLNHPERSFPRETIRGSAADLQPPFRDSEMAGGADKVEIPVLVGTTLAPGDDVIARESGTTTTAWYRANPTISFCDVACISAVFFIVRIERRCGGIRAEHLGAHQFESLWVG
jgi:hypothetical protein